MGINVLIAHPHLSQGPRLRSRRGCGGGDEGRPSFISDTTCSTTREPFAMSIRSATAIGFCAILLWSLLALFTAASGTVPPFQLAAMTFSSAVSSARRTFSSGRSGCRRCGSQAGRLGARRRRAVRLPRALLRGSAPRAAGRGRAHRLSLAAPHRPLLLAAAGRAPAPAACRRRAARLRRRRRARRRARAIGARADDLPGYLCALACAFVWSGYSVLSRRFGTVPTDAVAGFCLATAALACLCHLAFETTVWPGGPAQWLAILAPRPRAGRARLLRLGHRHQARRHPTAGRRLLRGAGLVDADSRGGRLRPGDALARARLRDDRRGRARRHVHAAPRPGITRCA